VVFAMDIVMAAPLMRPSGIHMHAPLAGLALLLGVLTLPWSVTAVLNRRRAAAARRAGP